MPSVTFIDISRPATGGEGPSGLILRQLEVSSNRHLLSLADSILSADEQLRAAGYHHQRDRERFVISRVALRKILGERLGIDPEMIRFTMGADRKPFLQDPSGIPVHFNVSHSADMVVIVVCSQQIGVDVELINPEFSFTELMATCFSAGEQQYITHSHDPRTAFYQLWTRKEALLKATGKGIDDDLAGIPCLDGAHTIAADTIGSTHNWSVKTFAIAPGYLCSVAHSPAVANILTTKY